MWIQHITIGTEVYMGEAGQDMYIETIGMLLNIIWRPQYNILSFFPDDTYVATDVQSVGELFDRILYVTYYIIML